MGEILIRNLDDAVIDALRRRAEASGISTEEEARRALAAAVALERGSRSQRLAEVRQLIGRIEGASTPEYLCSDRDRDHSRSGD